MITSRGKAIPYSEGNDSASLSVSRCPTTSGVDRRIAIGRGRQPATPLATHGRCALRYRSDLQHLLGIELLGSMLAWTIGEQPRPPGYLGKAYATISAG